MARFVWEKCSRQRHEYVFSPWHICTNIHIGSSFDSYGAITLRKQILRKTQRFAWNVQTMYGSNVWNRNAKSVGEDRLLSKLVARSELRLIPRWIRDWMCWTRAGKDRTRMRRSPSSRSQCHHLQDEFSFEEAFLRLNPQFKTKRRPRAGGKTIDLQYVLFIPLTSPTNTFEPQDSFWRFVRTAVFIR